jgi:hypothetical protein
MSFSLLAALAAAALASPVPPHAEQRCGWLSNPTPANWWLDDAKGEWILGMQGGYHAGGIDLPDMTTHDWVVTNPPDYGYGCACLKGVFSGKDHHVVTLLAVRSLPLARCKADRTLPPAPN